MAFPSIWNSSSCGRPARPRKHRERVHIVDRLVATPAHRLRREIGAIGLGEIRSGGTCAADARTPARSMAFGERDVVAALERGLEQVGLREAVQDDGARERRERGRGLHARSSAVDHDEPELVGEREVRLEERACSPSVSAPWCPSRPVSPTATTFGAPRSRRSSSTRAASAVAARCGRSRAPRRRRDASRRSPGPDGESMPVPIVTTRVTPASVALVSTRRGRRRRTRRGARACRSRRRRSFHSPELRGDDLRRIELGEQGSRRGCPGVRLPGSRRPVHGT